MQLDKSLAVSISLCIGRLANAVPEIISPYLSEFIKQVCMSLRNTKNSEEKHEAFVYI